MEREESLKRKDHYRCRLCGHISPLSATQCEKGSCRAQLSLYGEIITGEADTGDFGTPGGNQSDRGTTGTGSASGTGSGPKCPYCGAEVAPGAEECPRCSLRINSASAGSTAGKPDPETIVDSPREWKDRSGGMKQPATGWKTATIVTAILSVIMILILGVSLNSANEEAQRWRSGYNRLESDYNDMENNYEAVQKFLEMNGLDGLYSVRVSSVFNSDNDGKEINKKLVVGTMEHLAIRIRITAPAKDNRWAKDLTVKLTESGSEIANWTIKPNEHYDDSNTSCTWTMWTKKVTTPGTYVAEFYHKGYLIERYEITVK